MSELNNNPLIIVALGVVALIATFAAVRWWSERQYDMSGKTVLITSGSRGLGLVIARELVREGARLAICARDAAELERSCAELVQRGGEVLSVPCDITNLP